MSRTARVLASLVLIAGLAACSSGGESTSSDTSAPLKVGATPVPHAEILEYVRDNLAASAGLPTVLAFLLMLWNGMADAGRGATRDGAGDEVLPGLGAGLAGALGAFALTAVWHPLLVRGIGLPLALLLAATRYRKIIHEP